MEPCEIGSWKHHEKQHDHDSRFIRCAHLPVALWRRQLGLPHARLRLVHCPWDVKNGTPGQIMKLGESLSCRRSVGDSKSQLQKARTRLRELPQEVQREKARDERMTAVKIRSRSSGALLL